MFMCNTIIFVRLNNVLIKRENQVPVITSLLSTHNTSDELYAQVMFVNFVVHLQEYKDHITS